MTATTATDFAPARRQRLEAWLTALAVAGCAVFVLVELHPQLLVLDTTPAGGDMGAHVWAPAYLRDHLLTHGRLTGWTPDWYAGFPAYHFYMVVPSLLILALDVALPYGIAFKLVTVLGVLSLPVAAAFFGRMARLAFPGPALLAVATLPYLFNRVPQGTGNIVGGNIASTLAGEFAFSISLTLALLYLGLVVRGLETGRHRALAAVLLALTGLCHLIPAFFALAGTVVAFVMRPGMARVRWLAAVLPVGALVSAFWVLPFWWRRAYVNDMGWEKLHSYKDLLWPHDLRWAFGLAVVGAVLSVLLARRAGIFLLLVTAAMGAVVVLLPQGRLWNARILPFYYLGAFLLAGVAVSEIGSAVATLVARNPLRPLRSVKVATAVLGFGATLVTVGLPLAALPGSERGEDGIVRWAGLSTADRSYLPDWAKWNYNGYERKDAYAEYHAVVTTMARIGEERGCGRAMWEYEPELDRYGTPMALMLLPFWTDSCIGSMEGLYFEASATTPYHFINQAELSADPSSAMRDLPYAPRPLNQADFDTGIHHLQLLGVRYYLAFSPSLLGYARANPALTEIAASPPWAVFEVAGTALVQPLANEPAVLDGVSDAGREWLDPALAWYLDPPSWDVTLASSGLDGWQRVSEGDVPEPRPVPPVTVSGIRSGDDRISFDVDRPGTPVLVKASYFPNWHASGADGPFRVAPNLMVVVPTSTHVELHYGWTPVDLAAWAMTGLGVALALLLARRPPVAMPATMPALRRVERWAVPDSAVAWRNGTGPAPREPASPPPPPAPERRPEPVPTGGLARAGGGERPAPDTP
jgi:hypothetical protein